MRTIIAGPRDFSDILLVFSVIKRSGISISEVVTGDASGVDWIGACWGYLNRLPVKHFPARWDLFGNGAGPRRNIAMADYAHALIAIDMETKGTGHMIRTAKKMNLHYYVYHVQSNSVSCSGSL